MPKYSDFDLDLQNEKSFSKDLNITIVQPSAKGTCGLPCIPSNCSTCSTSTTWDL